jgi:hypothetical protein
MSEKELLEEIDKLRERIAALEAQPIYYPPVIINPVPYEVQTWITPYG